MTTENMQEYEILYFMSIALDENAISDVKTKVAEIIKKHKGTIIKEEDLNKKKLAYTIKGQRHGYFALVVFKCAPESANTISEEIKLMPEILRHKLGIKEDIKRVAIEDTPRTSEKPTQIKKEPVATENKETTEEEPVRAPVKDTELKSIPEEEKEEPKKKEASKVDLAELDKKIDELLGDDNI